MSVSLDLMTVTRTQTVSTCMGTTSVAARKGGEDMDAMMSGQMDVIATVFFPVTYFVDRKEVDSPRLLVK